MKSRQFWISAAIVGVLVALGFGSLWATANPTKIVYFDPESFTLSQQQKAELDELLPSLERAKVVEVRGYVQRSREDDKLTGPANLSTRRAETVARYLKSKLEGSGNQGSAIAWVVRGIGQRAVDVGLPDSRRVEIDVR